MRFWDSLPRFVFFTGKGGVGKTSLACATAIHLADAGRRVLLVSTDPASNIGQVLDQRIGNTVTPVAGLAGLHALEIDPQAAAAQFRSRVIDPVRGTLAPSEVDALTEQLSGACTTEIASFTEFATLLGDPRSTAGYDHVVFDTAPTGHTIRLLQLPGEWTPYLAEGKGDVSCLGPLAGLDALRDDYAGALVGLTDAGTTRLVLVTRPQSTALREAARAYRELLALGMSNAHLAVNGLLPEGVESDPLGAGLRRREQAALADLPPDLAGLPRTDVDLRPFDIMGLGALRGLTDDRAPDGDMRRAGEPQLPDAVGTLADIVDEIEVGGPCLVMTMGKGGVGKTTVAAAVAVSLARRGHEVLLTTTDPAGHLAEAVGGRLPRLTVTRIDPKAAVREYTDRVMATKGAGLDDDARTALAEDL
jgi:arsenite-transporting ATPase